MADEAVIITLLGNGGDPVRYTCSNTATIEKGTLLVLSDPVTVAASAAPGGCFGGIAAHEKVANDGSTTISAYTRGIFDIKCSQITTVGKLVSISAANVVGQATATDVENGSIVGKALETASVSEVIAVLVGCSI